jgi:hypothetical protein
LAPVAVFGENASSFAACLWRFAVELATLLARLRRDPEAVEFEQVQDVIKSHYRYTASAFRNGVADDYVDNAAGSNEGSCRIFAFAKLHGLDKAQTLACFGRYYRNDVLGNPQGTDHANIRTFMRHGLEGISFAGVALHRLD